MRFLMLVGHSCIIFGASLCIFSNGNLHQTVLSNFAKFTLGAVLSGFLRASFRPSLPLWRQRPSCLSSPLSPGTPPASPHASRRYCSWFMANGKAGVGTALRTRKLRLLRPCRLLCEILRSCVNNLYLRRPEPMVHATYPS